LRRWPRGPRNVAVWDGRAVDDAVDLSGTGPARVRPQAARGRTARCYEAARLGGALPTSAVDLAQAFEDSEGRHERDTTRYQTFDDLLPPSVASVG
jgi:hypothetical protein